MRVLVTGGAGYIGSHTVLELLHAGHEVTVVDNLVNSSSLSLRRLATLARGRASRFVQGDLRERELVFSVMRERHDAVIHFAGLKAVGESVQKPDLYRDVNVGGTKNLLDAMRQHGPRRLIFSSSCTVYGAVEKNPVDESHPRSAVNPYGQTKLDIELMCEGIAAAEPGWSMALLRYFNPVGAHESGTIGEDPRGTPNNLMPYLMQVAVGRQAKLKIFGNDYATPDGTCQRDFIHVVDLAKGHLAALQHPEAFVGARAVNLGTGKGQSVLEVLAAASKAVGKDIPHEFAPRRAGDAPAIWADPSLAQKLLGWTAEKTLDQMCADHWLWQKQNPNGYAA